MDQIEPPIDTAATTAKTLAQAWRDMLIVMVLAAGIGFASFQGAKLIHPGIVLDNVLYGDKWFDGDSPRIFGNMSNRWSSHHTTIRHPLFSLLTFPPVKALSIAGIEKLKAAKILIAVVAALWISALYLLLRLIGCWRIDAILFSLLAATSASAVFWFVVPETYSFGSLSILLALCTAAFAQYRKLPPRWYVVVSALTLSFTVTNWMAGILATFARFTWRQASQITANAFVIVVLLWSIQKHVFPSAGFFIDMPEWTTRAILDPNSGGPLKIVNSFVFHTMVLPEIKEAQWSSLPQARPKMTTQLSAPGSGSLWGTIGVGLWISLLGLGLWGLLSTERHAQLRFVLGFTLLGQLAVSLLFGRETFLYSLHFGPLLVVLAALSTLTRARPISLVLAGALVVSAGINNTIQFNKATEFIQRQAHHERRGSVSPAEVALESLSGLQTSREKSWRPAEYPPGPDPPAAHLDRGRGYRCHAYRDHLLPTTRFWSLPVQGVGS